jgi:heme a synthase
MGHVPGDLATRNGQGAPERPAALAIVKRWADTVLAPSTTSMRRIALAGVVTASGIIVTGAAVRLSQSGLGCPDWPKCTATSIVASGASGDPLVHRWVEFGNRLMTVAIFVVAVLVSVAAWRYTSATAGGGARRRRRDLLWLAAAQPAGIVAQAVLGGIVVLTRLDPVWVSVHFLASMALVVAAVALYVRCGESTARPRPLVPRALRLFAVGAVAVLGLMLTAGTVVTGTGPLAGAGDIARFHLPLGAVTQLHADIGWLLSGLVIALVLGMRLARAPRRAVRLSWLLLGLIGVQGAVGYAQYFSGLPAGLVWVHVTGAVVIWVTALLLLFSLRDRGGAEDPGPVAVVASEAGVGGAAETSAEADSAVVAPSLVLGSGARATPVAGGSLAADARRQ